MRCYTLWQVKTLLNSINHQRTHRFTTSDLSFRIFPSRAREWRALSNVGANWQRLRECVESLHSHMHRGKCALSTRTALKYLYIIHIIQCILYKYFVNDPRTMGVRSCEPSPWRALESNELCRDMTRSLIVITLSGHDDRAIMRSSFEEIVVSLSDVFCLCFSVF